MRFNPMRLAVAFGLMALLVSFFAINIAGLVWASYAAPHDGQGGIGPLLVSLVAAPVLAATTFVLFLAWARPRR